MKYDIEPGRFDLRGRIHRRVLTELEEGEGLFNENTEEPSTDDDGVQFLIDPDWELYGDAYDIVNIGTSEAEDSANPIAATAVVRKDAVTEIAPPDVEALLAAFSQ